MNVTVTHWLPGIIDTDGNRGPFEPCPDILTEEETVETYSPGHRPKGF